MTGVLGTLGAVAMVACIACVDESAQGPELAARGLSMCHDVTLEGIDVASFQGTIDWQQVAASGRTFAIARTSDGFHVDSTFPGHWQAMKDAGLIRGAYHFFRPTKDVDTQADIIADAVGVLGDGDLPVTIDFECMCPYAAGNPCKSSNEGCASPAEAAVALQALADRIEADTGKRPMIYTGAWFWNSSAYFDSAADMGDYPLWVSGYVGTSCVTLPTGWKDWTIWQYSNGTCGGCIDRDVPVPGIASAKVDRDRFNGTLADLQAFANGAPALGGTYVGQSFPLASVGSVKVRSGESAEAWIELRNTGTATWTSTTFIVTTEPRERSDPFADPSWPSAARPAHVAVDVTVAPGESYRFAWQWTVPADAAPGTYEEHYGLYEEGIGWFGDPAQGGPADGEIEAIIEVTPAGTTDVETTPDGDAELDGGDGATGPDTATETDARGDASTGDGDERVGASRVARLSVRTEPGGCGSAEGGPWAWIAAGATLGAVARRRRRPVV